MADYEADLCREGGLVERKAPRGMALCCGARHRRAAHAEAAAARVHLQARVHRHMQRDRAAHLRAVDTRHPAARSTPLATRVRVDGIGAAGGAHKVDAATRLAHAELDRERHLRPVHGHASVLCTWPSPRDDGSRQRDRQLTVVEARTSRLVPLLVRADEGGSTVAPLEGDEVPCAPPAWRHDSLGEAIGNGHDWLWHSAGVTGGYELSIEKATVDDARGCAVEPDLCRGRAEPNAELRRPTQRATTLEAHADMDGLREQQPAVTRAEFQLGRGVGARCARRVRRHEHEGHLPPPL